jgi:hypothetical protein
VLDAEQFGDSGFHGSLASGFGAAEMLLSFDNYRFAASL